MNLKVEFLKALVFVLIGAFLGQKFSPKPPPAKQAQTSKCVATIKKTTNPDGSVDEVTQFLAENSQRQESPPTSPPTDNFKLNIDSKLQIGAEANLFKNHWFGYRYDLKTHENIYQYSYSLRIF